MSLTENFAMLPTAAVSGFYFSHPEARYFAVGRIGDDQLADFARRAGISPDDCAPAPGAQPGPDRRRIRGSRCRRLAARPPARRDWSPQSSSPMKSGLPRSTPLWRRIV